MTGTKAGGLKAAATNRERHGWDFFQRIGRNGKRGPHKFKLKPAQIWRIEDMINGNHIDQYEAVGVVAIMLDALDYQGEYKPTLVKNKYGNEVFKFIKKEAK